jgi:hypothetical protein
MGCNFAWELLRLRMTSLRSERAVVSFGGGAFGLQAVSP